MRRKKWLLTTLLIFSLFMGLRTTAHGASPYNPARWVNKTVTVLTEFGFGEIGYFTVVDATGAFKYGGDIELGANGKNAVVNALGWDAYNSQYIRISGPNYNTYYGCYAYEIDINMYCMSDTPYLFFSMDDQSSYFLDEKLVYVKGSSQGSEFFAPVTDVDSGRDITLELGLNLRFDIVKVNYKYDVNYYMDSSLSYPSGCFPNSISYWDTCYAESPMYVRSSKPTKVGYDFTHWKDNNTGKLYPLGQYRPTGIQPTYRRGNVYLYPDWKANTINVTFDKNLGNGDSDIEATTATYNSPFTFPDAPLRDGYEFVGWQIYSGSDTKTNSTDTSNNGEGSTIYEGGQTINNFDLATKGEVKLAYTTGGEFVVTDVYYNVYKGCGPTVHQLTALISS